MHFKIKYTIFIPLRNELEFTYFYLIYLNRYFNIEYIFHFNFNIIFIISFVNNAIFIMIQIKSCNFLYQIKTFCY